MNKLDLTKKYKADNIGKTELGQLRRIALEEKLEMITSLDAHHIIEWLDTKKSKIQPKKLALAVGYGTTSDTLRQTLKPIVKAAELKLTEAGHIKVEAKSNIEISQENETGLLGFLNERMSEASYNWPVNNRNRLYQRVLWAFYLDMPVAEIKSAPTFFSRNQAIKRIISEIDIQIAKGERKTLNYEAESALEDMETTMTSAAISKLRQQVNEFKRKFSLANEKVKLLETDNKQLILQLAEVQRKLHQLEHAEESLLGSNLMSDIKISGAH